MANSPESKSNPESIGMQESSFDTAESNDTGSDAFFDNLDSQVNGQIQDTEVTPNIDSGPEQVTHQNIEQGSDNVVEQSSDGTDWQKRYTDSSREAVKWRDKFRTVEPFVPVLEAMKNDSGLVEHVRGYLLNGGPPAESIQKSLKLDEDFIFDGQEAVTDPDSDSAKVMNAHVDGIVQQRVGQMLSQEKKHADQQIKAAELKKDEQAFIKKHNMSNEDFATFKEQANTHSMTLDDIHTILNKDKTAKNVAESTQNDMITQMKNVRSMPTSASGANSQGSGHKSQDREVFENILGFDNSKDNLFG